MNQATFDQAIAQACKEIAKAPITPKVFSLSVKKKYHEWKLVDMYAHAFPHVSKSFWENKIRSGNLTVNQQKVLPTFLLKAGMISQHAVPANPEPEVNTNLQLIAATPSYWVINKPSPLPVHAGGRYQKNSLTHLLKTAFPQQNIHLINRLDANTTGIVLVALHKEVAQFLGKQFEHRTVKKTYLAKVEGVPKSNKFSSSKSISKEKTSAGGRKLEEGYASFTEFEVIETYENESLLQVIPQSGRTNQIRLHLADMGHPIVGDLGYKNPDYFENNPLTYPSDSLFLHAWKLTFIDPDSKVTVQFSALQNEKWGEFLF